MTIIRIIALICICVLNYSAAIAEDKDKEKITIRSKIVEDYKDFYSKRRLKERGYMLLSIAVLANTKVDENFRSWFQDDIRSENTNDIAKEMKNIGEAKFWIPLSILASGAYFIKSDSKIGEWGVNTARAYAVGGPAMVLMQKAVGSSRPVTTSHSSKWRPFNDAYGASGHAFAGVVPFLTLAKMNPDNKLIKYTAYTASTFAAASRINTDSHYLSQVLLGWYIAYDAVNTVAHNNKKSSLFTIQPAAINDAIGFSVSASW